MLSQITAGSVSPGLGWPVVGATASPSPVGWQGSGTAAVPRETPLDMSPDAAPDAAPDEDALPSADEVLVPRETPLVGADDDIEALDELDRAELASSIPEVDDSTPLMQEIAENARRRIALRGRRFPRRCGPG